MASVRLDREVFHTSRLLEFCSQNEPVAQTGHTVEDWPFVIVKGLVDNGLDSAEEHGIAPLVTISMPSLTGEITSPTTDAASRPRRSTASSTTRSGPVRAKPIRALPEAARAMR